jgi:hypothetical protein
MNPALLICFLLSAGGSTPLTGGPTHPAGGPIRHADPKTLHLIYVDNSHARGFENFSPEMLDLVAKKIDSIHQNRNDDISLYASNGQNPDFVGNYKGAKSEVDKLSNGYTAEPYSPFDKTAIIDRIANSDLTGIKRLRLYFFVGESDLTNDLLKTNSGLLLNILPAELRLLTNVDEDQVSVYIFYPATAKPELFNNILNSCRLLAAPGVQHSGIHYYVQGI